MLKAWDEITSSFSNFNGCTVEVWEWLSYLIPHFIWAYAYLTMLGLYLIHVSKRDPESYEKGRAICRYQRPRYCDNKYCFGTPATAICGDGQQNYVKVLPCRISHNVRGNVKSSLCSRFIASVAIYHAATTMAGLDFLRDTRCGPIAGLGVLCRIGQTPEARNWCQRSGCS